MHADLTRDTSSVVWTLFGVVGLLLMIGCVNVASLMLLRAACRCRDVAIRIALGASRRELLRQLATAVFLFVAVMTSMAPVMLATRVDPTAAMREGTAS